MSKILPQLKRYGAFKKHLQEAAKLRVIVGAPDSPHPETDGLTNGQLLMIHEYGTAEIPARPILRTTIREKKDDLIKALSRDILALRDRPESASPLRAYKKLALRLEGAVKQKFRDNDFAPLAESTIRAKGSSKPLIDTGALRQSIEGKVIHVSEMGQYTGESGE